MSLINDALKRASEAEKRRAGIRPGARRGPKGPEALGPPIEPVKRRRRSLLRRQDFWTAMFTFALVSVAGAFLYSWWKSQPPKFVLNVPPGKDPLEMMIVKKAKKKPEQAGPLVIGDGGVLSGGKTDAATNTVTTNTMVATNLAASAETNLATSVLTNEVVDPVAAANPVVSVGPDVDPRMKPDPPETDRTNAPTLLKPVKLPATTEPGGTQGTIVTTPGPDKMEADEDEADKDEALRSEKTKPFPEILLKGIVLMKTNAVAFVNGKTIRVGDSVDGVELVEIGIDYVKLDLEGQVRQFYLQR